MTTSREDLPTGIGTVGDAWRSASTLAQQTDGAGTQLASTETAP